MDATTRIGVYWIISCLGFTVLFVVALWRFLHQPTRERNAIIAFASAWAILCGQNAITRFAGASVLDMAGKTEIIRLAGCLTLLWLIAEYVVLTGRDRWDGTSERRVIPHGRRQTDQP